MLFQRRRRFALLALAVTLFVASGSPPAVAAEQVDVSRSHTTKKSLDHVLKVLTAYGQTCDEGCKYYGPDVKEHIRLAHKRTKDSFYTFTWVSSIKDVKFFSHVTIHRAPGKIVMRTRLLTERDASVIKELTEKSGREHNPAFASGHTVFSIVEKKDEQGKVIGTQVTQAMSATVSGMLTMFTGQIRDGMVEGAQATFQNIEK